MASAEEQDRAFQAEVARTPEFPQFYNESPPWLKAANNEFRQNQHQIAQQTETIRKLNTELMNVKKQNEKLVSDFNKQKEVIENQLFSIQERNDQTEKLKADIAALKAKHDEAQTHKLREGLQTLEAEKETLCVQLSEASATNKQLMEAANVARQSLEQKDAEITQMNQHLQNRGELLEAAQREQAAVAERARALQANVEQMKQDKTALITEVHTQMEQMRNETAAELSALADKTNQFQQEKQSLLDDVKDYQEKLEAAALNVASCKTSGTEAENLLRIQKQAMDNMTRIFGEQMHHLDGYRKDLPDNDPIPLPSVRTTEPYFIANFSFVTRKVVLLKELVEYVMQQREPETLSIQRRHKMCRARYGLSYRNLIYRSSRKECMIYTEHIGKFLELFFRVEPWRRLRLMPQCETARLLHGEGIEGYGSEASDVYVHVEPPCDPEGMDVDASSESESEGSEAKESDEELRAHVASDGEESENDDNVPEQAEPQLENVWGDLPIVWINEHVPKPIVELNEQGLEQWVVKYTELRRIMEYPAPLSTFGRFQGLRMSQIQEALMGHKYNQHNHSCTNGKPGSRTRIKIYKDVVKKWSFLMPYFRFSAKYADYLVHPAILPFIVAQSSASALLVRGKEARKYAMAMGTALLSRCTVLRIPIQESTEFVPRETLSREDMYRAVSEALEHACDVVYDEYARTEPRHKEYYFLWSIVDQVGWCNGQWGKTDTGDDKPANALFQQIRNRYQRILCRISPEDPHRGATVMAADWDTIKRTILCASSLPELCRVLSLFDVSETHPYFTKTVYYAKQLVQIDALLPTDLVVSSDTIVRPYQVHRT